MPINTIKCKECGNRIHYPVFDIDMEKTVTCTRCGTENWVSSADLSPHVADEIRELQEENDLVKQQYEQSFRPSFEGDDGMPKSEWKPGGDFFASDEADLDEKLDSVREKFSIARNELKDVGSTFSPVSANELISEFVADDVDLTVNIPLDENDTAPVGASLLKRKALDIIAKRFFQDDLAMANEAYMFVETLYRACKEQELDFDSIAQNADTVLSFAERSGFDPRVVGTIEELYNDGTASRLFDIASQYLK